MNETLPPAVWPQPKQAPTLPSAADAPAEAPAPSAVGDRLFADVKQYGVCLQDLPSEERARIYADALAEAGFEPNPTAPTPTHEVTVELDTGGTVRALGSIGFNGQFAGLLVSRDTRPLNADNLSAALAGHALATDAFKRFVSPVPPLARNEMGAAEPEAEALAAYGQAQADSPETPA